MQENVMHSICIFTWTASVVSPHCKQTEIAQSILCNNYNIGMFLIGIIALLYADLSQYCWENWLEKQVFILFVFLPGITKIGLYKCVDSARMSSFKLQLKWLHIIVLFLQCCVIVVICMNHVPWPLRILAEYAYATNFFSSAIVFCHVNHLL